MGRSDYHRKTAYPPVESYSSENHYKMNEIKKTTINVCLISIIISLWWHYEFVGIWKILSGRGKY